MAHQRSKLERYGDTLFVVLRAARYLDRPEAVEFAELHVFVGPDFVVTVRHGEGPDLSRVRAAWRPSPTSCGRGPEAILYAILDRVVDDYEPVVAGLENDIDEIETEVFSGNASVTRRTYELAREVIEFQRATKPLVGDPRRPDRRRRQARRRPGAAAVPARRAGPRHPGPGAGRGVPRAAAERPQRQPRHRRVAAERRGQGPHRASIAQNDDVKRISAWAAILFAPTLIGTVYGMNFDHMPELHW